MTKQAQAGEVIENRYRLERPLGSGGMGAVWLATQLMVDRPVAVKLLHPAFIDQKDLQARFEVEAKAIGKLNHPNVVTLYDFGFSTELEAFYTVIEYIDGVSLDKRLNERMPLQEVCDIIRMVALALDHAHHHGILHRDLKPENVMLARMTDGSLMTKVLDFGIARIVKGTYEVESPESQRITKAGEVFGTPAYMSPEQARSIRRLTPASDLYALGIMFYELVAGRLPFFAKSAFDLLMLHVTKPVPPIQRNDVPPELIGIIYRLLEKDPESRFQSGAELARAIERVQVPDEASMSGDNFDQYPTIVNSKNRPTFPGSPPQMSLGNEETNPDSASFELPTPGHTPSSTEIRAQTVLLNGGQPANQWGYRGADHDTIPDTKERRYIAFAAAALVLVLSLVAAAALLRASLAGPEEPNRQTSDNMKKILNQTADPKPGDEVANNKKTPPPAEKLPKPPEEPPDEPEELEKKDDEPSPTEDEKSDDAKKSPEPAAEPKPKPKPKPRPKPDPVKKPLMERLPTD